MEGDPELKGQGNSYTTEFRQYDPRIGRWLTPDLLAAKATGWNPYRFGFNNPVIFTDENGLYETKREARQARRGASDHGYDVGKIQGKKGNYYFIAISESDKSSKETIVRVFVDTKLTVKAGKYKGGVEFYDAADARGAIPAAQAHLGERFNVGGYTVVPYYVDNKLDHYVTSITVTDPSTMQETQRFDFVIGRDKLDHFEENVGIYGLAANMAFGANVQLDQYQIDLANGNYGSAIGGRLKQEWTDVEAILDAVSSIPVKKPSLRIPKKSYNAAPPNVQKQIRKKTRSRLKRDS